MTATAAMISYVSPYVVSDSVGTFSTAKFNHLSAVAKEQLDAEDPGLSSALYDQAHALLICHLYMSATLGMGGVTSERVGTYGYSRGDATPYYLEYRRIVENKASSVAFAAGGERERTDHKMNDMKLDQLGTPEYGHDEEGTER